MTVPLVTEYDPKWPAWFESIQTRLELALTAIDHRVEHVGSTAVPGMIAKPIIDLDLVVERQDFSRTKERLAAIGYVHQGDLGILDREAFDVVDAQLKKILPPHHLYVCVADADALFDRLAFRDFLRKSPEWVRRLSLHKRQLCEQGRNDRKKYMDGKAAMVREITGLARERSARTW